VEKPPGWLDRSDGCLRRAIATSISELLYGFLGLNIHSKHDVSNTCLGGIGVS
jgi:hypothetical protein